MIDTDTKLLIDTLKQRLRKSGLTYKKIARELEVSEVTIKRIFSNYDCSLSKLAQITKLAGMTLIELSELANKSSKNINYFLTKEQENYFSKNPFSFYIFRELYRGIDLSKLKKENSLNESDLFTILRKLEKLHLIDLFPGNKVKFKISGQIRLNLNGPLFNKLIKKQNIHFLETVYDNIDRVDCCMQASEVQLTKASISMMVQEVNALGRKYREKAYLEENTLPQKELINTRWLFGLLPYKTDWRRK